MSRPPSRRPSSGPGRPPSGPSKRAPSRGTGKPARPPREAEPRARREAGARSGAELPSRPREEAPRAPRSDAPRAPRSDAPRAPHSDAPRAPRGDAPRAPRSDAPRAPRSDAPGAPRGDDPRAARGDATRATRGDAPRPPRDAGEDRPFRPLGERPSRSVGGPAARGTYGQRPDGAAKKPRVFGAKRGFVAKTDRGATRNPTDRAPRSAPPRASTNPAPFTPATHPPEAAAEAPSRGRDRRGSGEPKLPRQLPTAPAPREPRPSQAAIARDVAPGGTIWLYGLHAVAAALANPRRGVKRLLLTVDAEAALADRLPRPWRIQAERVEKNRFQTFLLEDSIHQGAALLCEPLQPLPLDVAIATRPGPVLVLDQVTDPRNVGAILRSAAAFGACCVVMQDRHAPPETGALARAASGALELVPIAREVNLSRAIVALQKAGFWVLGLAGEGKRSLAEAVPRDRRSVLVLGAEDAGLRRLQRETCDELVHLPMAEEVESLNVAAAAAVALYEIARGAPEADAEAPDPQDEDEDDIEMDLDADDEEELPE